MTERERLPWDIIDSYVTQDYFNNELKRSKESKYTEPCTKKCNQCGICKHEQKIFKNKSLDVNQKMNTVNVIPSNSKSDPSVYRILFSFCKKGSSVFHGHLSLIEIFSISLRRARIPVIYTKGFNPLIKIEFPSPLSTGITAECEIASVDLYDNFETSIFISTLNKCLPLNISIVNSEIFLIESGMKKHSLSSLLWGFAYYGAEENIDYVNLKQEKSYRQDRLSKDCETMFSLRRKETLAYNIIGGTDEWASYFDVYRFLYPHPQP
jgi:uncharacterized protein (DUF2344 family)